MMLCYVDSSALVKRYARELGSEWIQSLTDPSAAHAVYIAQIGTVEVAVMTPCISRRQCD